MGGFGAPYRALSGAAVEGMATPPSGASQEAIWHQVYDTQTYGSGTTTRLVFFQNTNNDRTLSNMEAAGQFPSPQSFQIFNVCCDIITSAGVTTDAATGGAVDDVWKLLLGARATWALNISSKVYGPYSLTLLHATGQPYGLLSSTVATSSQQQGQTSPFPGWNYFGRVIIPRQVNFNITLEFASAQTLKGDAQIRLSMLGVLNRRVV